MRQECVGQVTVDVTKTTRERITFIRIRATNVWRLKLAYQIVFMACFVARCLGVGVRMVPDGVLYVPRRKRIAEVEQRRKAANGE